MIKDIKSFQDVSKREKVECICDYCEKLFNRTKNNIERSHKHLKKDSCDNKECIEKKKKEIFNLKYGCDNPFQSKVIKQKIINKNIEKYGVSNPTQNEDIKRKQQDTCLKKYGAKNVFQSDAIKEKIKKQNLELYGVENNFQRKEVQEKQKLTIKKRYKVDHYSKTDEYKQKTIKTNIEKYGSPFPTHKYGKTQNEIKDWVNSFNLNFSSDYEILENKEIDLLDKEKKIGIEYCGLHWHHECSPEPRDRNYHLNKHLKCLEKDIQLITIFEDEWKFKQTQCKSHIKSILGIHSKKIFARKCTIKEISKLDAKSFFDSYHIQGSNKLGIVFFGLFNKDNLCAVMSLGRHNRQNSNSKEEITLDRLCFKDGVQIVGGASKLFAKCSEWAKNNGYKKIISFSDNRWSSGKVYEKIGFSLEKEYSPDYSYVEVNSARKRISKQSQKKSATNCPTELTEHVWAIQRGLARIYDCGKKKWMFNLVQESS